MAVVFLSYEEPRQTHHHRKNIMSAIRVLIVCRGRTTASGEERPKAPFIEEQAATLRKIGIAVTFCFVRSGGFWGYGRAILFLHRQLKSTDFDIVHAHHGLGGLVGRAQWRRPLVVTFHGSDLYRGSTRLISRVVAATADWRILVSSRLANVIGLAGKRNSSIIPCAVDLNVFKPGDRDDARKRLGLAV